LGHQLWDREVHVVRQTPDRAAIMGLARFDADGLKENGGGYMMRVRHEWDGHPWPDRLIRQVNAPRLAAGAISEDECACQRQREGEANGERTYSGSSHDLI
jgi:hypothetical protein